MSMKAMLLAAATAATLLAPAVASAQDYYGRHYDSDRRAYSYGHGYGYDARYVPIRRERDWRRERWIREHRWQMEHRRWEREHDRRY